MSNTQTNEVVQKITVKDPTGRGWQKLSEDAKRASAQVKQSVEDAQRKIDAFRPPKNVGGAGGGMAGQFGGLKGVGRGMAGFAGRSALASTGLGEIGGGVAGELAMMGGLGTSFAVLAALAGGVAVSTTIPGVSDFYAKQLSGTKFGDLLGINAGASFDDIEAKIKYLDNPINNPRLSGEEYNRIQGENYAKQLMKSRAMKMNRPFGFGDPASEEHYAKEAALRDPLDARENQLKNMEEKLRMVAGMSGKSAGEVSIAEATLEREQSLRRVFDLQQKLSQVGETEGTKRLNLTRQLAAAQEVSFQSEQKRLQVISQQSMAIKSQIDMQHGKAQMEMDRLNSAKEQFGLMDPMKQQGIADAARRMMAGAHLGQEDIDLLGSSEITREQLARYGRRKADDIGIFEPLLKLTQDDHRLMDARRDIDRLERVKVDIDQKISAEVTLNEEALAQQLAIQLVPRLHELMNAAREQAKQEFNKFKMEQNAARGAMVGP